MDFTKFSRNYKINMPWTGSVENNVIFDSANYMPREVTLATTLDTFNLELLEVLFYHIYYHLIVSHNICSLNLFFGGLFFRWDWRVKD